MCLCCHFQEEARHPLLRAFDQKQYVTLCPAQFAAGHRKQFVADRRVPCSKRVQCTSLDHGHFRVGYRLGRKCMRFGELQAENVAREIKATDLPTAVVQNLVSADATADDSIDVISGFVLAEYLAVARK